MPQSQPLSPNEIRDRALKFAHEWAGERRERAEAQTYWNEFFNVFGVSRRRVASFEEFVRPVRQRLEASDLFRKGGKPTGTGFIDLLWKGVLIAEHKSLDKDLDSAYVQALDYFDGLAERDLPRYVIVSDFARFRLYDLEEKQQNEFPLADLHKNIGLFGFIAGYTTQRIQEQDPVNIKAAEKMGRLHDQLKAGGYVGHDLEVLLVRLLFCLFAEDTTIFDQKGMFRDWLETCTRDDGSDLGSQLELLFQVLNMPEDRRQKNLDERFAAFPYVNGKLFEERLNVAAFTSGMRAALLDCCALDWGRISPAIFGALFQSVMDDQARRNLGAHYTSEKNILKVVKSLFLDELRVELEKARSNRNRLFELHKRIAALHFLDPACGCGNFLVIAYRELRLLELGILRAMLRFERESGQRVMDVIPLINVNVDQFYGIELEEFPAQIAQVALWLMDHQMNMRVSEEFGFYYRRLPLTHAATIRCANALRIDWNEVISAERVDYILGNPPFVGAKYMEARQRADMESVCGDIPSYGLLDYVTAWYVRAVQYLKGDAHTQDLLMELGGKAPMDKVKIAFVSTNSITQGEQVAVLWSWLLGQGTKIYFAHRTFQWMNEARGMAAVHCVIIGFALFDTADKRILDYPDIKGDPHETAATNINPYLVDAVDVLIGRRDTPVSQVPEIRFGNQPIDGGGFLFTEEEMKAFIEREPKAKKLIHRYMGSDELINNIPRYCLWLKGVSPDQLRTMPLVMERIEAVKKFRLSSKRLATRELAEYPTQFAFVSQPDSNYLAIPSVSSERRPYIPIGFFGPEVIASNLCLIIPDAKKFHFGILSSAMHMAWVRYVAGRLKSDYRYSNQIVYSNYPWPELVASAPSVRAERSRPSAGEVEVHAKRPSTSATDVAYAQDERSAKLRAAIETGAQGVLDARKQFPDASLADLYDPVAMPPALRQAHAALDRAVDARMAKRISIPTQSAWLFSLTSTRNTPHSYPPPQNPSAVITESRVRLRTVTVGVEQFAEAAGTHGPPTAADG
ncbi:MAG TPA: DNA methyltransferase [Gammaproteobacteria bacterium]|nr:DNA methyltransferase [Gammaproteobacteria bacterium]